MIIIFAASSSANTAEMAIKLHLLLIFIIFILKECSAYLLIQFNIKYSKEVDLQSNWLRMFDGHHRHRHTYFVNFVSGSVY
jgi:hypothetical protein